VTSEGYGGKSGNLRNDSGLLDGVLTSDPETKPKPGWNKRKYVKTPFGWLAVTGWTELTSD
jgi:hypothetical protein